MKKIYVANDGTQFQNVNDCFNHEWLNDYPEIRCFDDCGMRVSEVHLAATIRVYTQREQTAVHDYLCEVTDLDYIPSIGEGTDGAFLWCDGDPVFCPVENICEEYGMMYDDEDDFTEEMRQYMPREKEEMED